MNEFKLGFIEKYLWGVAYKIKENETVKNCMFLRDKHLYSTVTLNQILARAGANKSNSEGDLKCVYDMIKWWIVVRITLLKIIPKFFEVVEKEREKTTTAT